MKIKNKILFGLILLSIGGVSCKKYLDINTNPLQASKVEPNLLFGYAITAWDVNKNSGDGWLPISLFSQTIASGANYGWGKDNVYKLSSFTLGNTWKAIYSTGGNNLKLAIQAAESAVPVNNNAAAQCKIVLAQMLYEGATLYGDVPLSQAFQVNEFPYPKYDAQKDVLENIIKLLDEASAQIDLSSSDKITTYDIFYSGNMNSWKKLANSIKLKVLMVMVDKDPTKAAAIGQLVSNPATMITSATENWLYKYYALTSNENPKYRLLKQYTNGKNIWFFANSNVFDYMNTTPTLDPRVPRYFEKGGDGQYRAVATEATANANTSLISAYLYRQAAPSVLLSYQEILLLQAEAYARGLGVSKDLVKAQGLFKSGVQAAMTFYEADPINIDLFINGKAGVAPTLPDLTTNADPVKQIHLQQWIDLMDRPMEAFLQWRRSGPEGSEVPALTLPLGAFSGPLIRRFTVSPDEIASNPNIPNPLPKYNEKMWFDL